MKDEAYAAAHYQAARSEASKADELWNNMPKHLRERATWLLKRGRRGDAERMFDAATEIEWLRAALHVKKTGLVD